MNNYIKKTYLRQSYADNWETYQKSLEKAGSLPQWDYFIVTASNERQAEAYRIQIEERLNKGYLSSETEYIVIADPEGKRVGSGGATLNALYEVAKRYQLEGEEPFREKRILIIHSGGDSKRIPQYSAFGKLFSRVPRVLPDGRYSTLFDEFVIALSGVPTRMSEGVLIASGDVLLLCNTNQMDLTREGVVGMAMKVEVKTGTEHGVYKLDTSSKVSKFLHKVSVSRLKAEEAVNQLGLVNVDTGLIWLDADVAGRMLGLVFTAGKIDESKYSALINDRIRLNFYGDFLIPFTQDSIYENYLMEPAEGEYCKELFEARKAIWNTFHGTSMYVQTLSPAQFIHFGTTAELGDLMTNIDMDYSFLDWSREVVSVDERTDGSKTVSAINSYIGNDIVLGENVFIEDSRLSGSTVIGKQCMLSNLVDENGFRLDDSLVLHTLPIQDEEGNKGYITRVYGVEDNPKKPMEEGTFLGKPLCELVKLTGMKIETLWNAELYPIFKTAEESLRHAIWLSQIGIATEQEIKKWLTLKRYSLKRSYEIADLKEILDKQQETESFIRAKMFVRGALNKQWIREIYEVLGNDTELISKRIEMVLELSKKMPPSIDRARLYRYVVEVGKRSGINWGRLEDYAYEDIAQLIREDVIGTLQRAKMEQKKYTIKQITIEMPARVNFGGGCSDTPPYNMENGGTVLNAAIRLKGKLPIKVQAGFIKEPLIRLVSKDLGIHRTYKNLEELLRYNDPTDPLALHKAALVVTGILPLKGNEKQSLRSILSNIGYGIEVVTQVDIPKGSGLGTSSILAGAVVKALNELLGVVYDNNKLFREVLCVEQLLTTGGGWQDQVGGLVPGIKLITSQKGITQNLEVIPLRIQPKTLEELNERMVLVYTGQRRLAKGILRKIMGEYILGHPEKIEILNEIQKMAIMMKYELEKGNIEKFCELLNIHFRMSIKLDQGSTNNYIDAIIEVCKPYTEGIMICGAGGGGFLQLILRNKNQKMDLINLLEQVFGDNHVEVWDMSFYLG